MSGETVLDVEHLRVELQGTGRRICPVDDVSFSVKAGEIMGLVGESGSGKTLTCRAIAGLVADRAKPAISGTIRVAGKRHDPMAPGGKGVPHEIAMIFQNPSTYLDPLMPIWRQVAEPLIFNDGVSVGEAHAEAVSLLKKVGIPDAARTARAYPHQLSGGMKQRVMIASALACKSKVLFADEPTTALDVTVQMQILRLLLFLRDDLGLSIVFVSHDLAVIGSICDSISVMYAGKIAEQGDCRSLLESPRHPYTQALLHSSPAWERRTAELQAIPGGLPSLYNLPTGCRFAPRCRFAVDRCRQSSPELEAVDGGNHRVACFRARELMENHDIDVA